MPTIMGEQTDARVEPIWIRHVEVNGAVGVMDYVDDPMDTAFFVRHGDTNRESAKVDPSDVNALIPLEWILSPGKYHERWAWIIEQVNEWKADADDT